MSKKKYAAVINLLVEMEIEAYGDDEALALAEDEGWLCVDDRAATLEVDVL